MTIKMPRQANEAKDRRTAEGIDDLSFIGLVKPLIHNELMVDASCKVRDTFERHKNRSHNSPAYTTS
jgi:hypothetical protein